MKPELCACYIFCSRTWCWVIPACWLCVWWSPQNLLGVGRECPHWLPLWLESRPQQSYRGGERRLREGLAGQCLKPWRQGPGVGGRLAEERVSILGTETSGVGCCQGHFGHPAWLKCWHSTMDKENQAGKVSWERGSREGVQHRAGGGKMPWGRKSFGKLRLRLEGVKDAKG